MKTANFEVEFELEGLEYRVDGIAYYYDQADEDVDYFQREIDHLYIQSCMVYREDENEFVIAEVTGEMEDVVRSKLEFCKGNWG
jgi:hypothetical protein